MISFCVCRTAAISDVYGATESAAGAEWGGCAVATGSLLVVRNGHRTNALSVYFAKLAFGDGTASALPVSKCFGLEWVTPIGNLHGYPTIVLPTSPI
nr:hypothetical protein GCM10017611_13920 [Rhodococcus wratislaviensis]